MPEAMDDDVVLRMPGGWRHRPWCEQPLCQGECLTAPRWPRYAVVEAVDGTPLTVVQEWELYVTRGVVPSDHAIHRALREDRDDVLRMLDSLRDARRGAEARA